MSVCIRINGHRLVRESCVFVTRGYVSRVFVTGGYVSCICDRWICESYVFVTGGYASRVCL